RYNEPGSARPSARYTAAVSAPTSAYSSGHASRISTPRSYRTTPTVAAPDQQLGARSPGRGGQPAGADGSRRQGRATGGLVQIAVSWQGPPVPITSYG